MKRGNRKLIVGLFISFLTGIGTNLQAAQPADTLGWQDTWLYNYQSAADLAAYLPGVIFLDSGVPGAWSGFTVGGSTPQQSLLYWNGFPLQDVWTGTADLSLVPDNLIGRAAVSLNDGVGGRLDVISRRFHRVRPVSRFVYRMGSQSYNDLDVLFGQGLGKAMRLQSGFQLKNFSEADSSRGLRSKKLHASLDYHPFSWMRAQYTILNNVIDLNLPWDVRLPTDTLLHALPHYKRLRYDHLVRLELDGLGLRHTLKFSRTLDDIELHENYANRRVIPVRSTWLELSQSLPDTVSSLSWGIRMQMRSLTLQADSSFRDWLGEAFLRTNYWLTKNLQGESAVTGHRSAAGKHFWGGAQAFFWIPYKTFTLSLKMEAAQREPSLSERFGLPVAFTPAGLPWTVLDNGTFRSAADLQPEKGYTVSAEILWGDSTASLRLRPFLRQIEDQITFAEKDSLWLFQNSSTCKTGGLTIAACTRPLAGVSIRTAAFYRFWEENLPYGGLEPGLSGSAALAMRHIFFQGDLDLRLVISCRYRSAHNCFAGDALDPISIEKLDQAFFLDGKLTAVVIHNAIISLALDNLLNADHAYFAGFPQRGRSFRFSLDWILYD